MKFMIASDLHGSAYWTKKVIEQFHLEKADYLVLLGDLLYHGPRNPLPKEYCPQEVIQLLNGIKDKVIAVRGNCDSEVDQMVLEFPMMADYNIIPLENKKIFISHGHLYHPEALPASLVAGDIFLFGHIHIPVVKEQDGVYLFNPGSVSLPKEGHPSTYAILESTHFMIKTFSGEIYQQVHLSKEFN